MSRVTEHRDEHDAPPQASDPTWFREPTPREHAIGAALVAGFALFFLTLAWMYSGWWLRWVMLIVGMLSLGRAARHAWRSLRGSARPQ